MQHDPLQISINDYRNIDFEMIKRHIIDDCRCIHDSNNIIFYDIEYRNGGISIDYSFENCRGQAIVYIGLDYAFREIDHIVECEFVEEVVEI